MNSSEVHKILNQAHKQKKRVKGRRKDGSFFFGFPQYPESQGPTVLWDVYEGQRVDTPPEKVNIEDVVSITIDE